MTAGSFRRRRGDTVRSTMTPGARELGWNEDMEQAWRDLGCPGVPARVSRLDRGWSTVLTAPESSARVRNIGADVAVGDWVVPSEDGERVERVLPRRSRAGSGTGSSNVMLKRPSTIIRLNIVPPTQLRMLLRKCYADS